MKICLIQGERQGPKAGSCLSPVPWMRKPARNHKVLKVCCGCQGSQLHFIKRSPSTALRNWGRSILLKGNGCEQAADEALQDADWHPEQAEDQERTGVAVGVGMPSPAELGAAGHLIAQGKLRRYAACRFRALRSMYVQNNHILHRVVVRTLNQLFGHGDHRSARVQHKVHPNP